MAKLYVLLLNTSHILFVCKFEEWHVVVIVKSGRDTRKSWDTLFYDL